MVIENIPYNLCTKNLKRCVLIKHVYRTNENENNFNETKYGKNRKKTEGCFQCWMMRSLFHHYFASLFHSFVLFWKCARGMKKNPYYSILCIEFNAAMVVVLRSLVRSGSCSLRGEIACEIERVSGGAELRAAYKGIQMDPHSEALIVSQLSIRWSPTVFSSLLFLSDSSQLMISLVPSPLTLSSSWTSNFVIHLNSQPITSRRPMRNEYAISSYKEYGPTGTFGGKTDNQTVASSLDIL